LSPGYSFPGKQGEKNSPWKNQEFLDQELLPGFSLQFLDKETQGDPTTG